MAAAALLPLALLFACLLFVRYGFVEGGRECFVLAAIYGIGALLLTGAEIWLARPW